MEVLYSAAIRTLVFDDEGRAFTAVAGFIIEPSGGKVVGVLVYGGRDLMISARDVITFSAEKLVVEDRDLVVEVEDIVRAQEVVSKGFYFLKCKVFDKEGVYLGKVFDYGIDSVDLRLRCIWVAKEFLNLARWEKRRFDFGDIAEVFPGKIVVLDSVGKVYEKEPQPVNG